MSSLSTLVLVAVALLRVQMLAPGQFVPVNCPGEFIARAMRQNVDTEAVYRIGSNIHTIASTYSKQQPGAQAPDLVLLSEYIDRLRSFTGAGVDTSQPTRADAWAPNVIIITCLWNASLPKQEAVDEDRLVVFLQQLQAALQSIHTVMAEDEIERELQQPHTRWCICFKIASKQ